MTTYNLYRLFFSPAAPIVSYFTSVISQCKFGVRYYFGRHTYLQGLGSKGISICNKIKQPSKADAQVLRNLFPASGPSRKRSYTFDPTSQCVAADQQRKKKKAIRNRVSKVTILQVNNVARGIPKGKYRRELKKDGQEVVVKLKRNMSAREVKNSLIRGTKLSNYQILAPSQVGKLVYAENQDPTGDEVIENITKRKFPMYISEKEHVISMAIRVLC